LLSLTIEFDTLHFAAKTITKQEFKMLSTSCFTKLPSFQRAFQIHYRRLSTKRLVSWSFDDAAKIGTITLESPETYNALTVEMGKEFSQVVQTVKNQLDENDINVMILQGAGKAFSAGGNLEWLQSLGDVPVHKNIDAMLSFYKSFLCIRELQVPVIAAIQGPAVGAGVGLALACDLRVTSPGPRKLGFTFSRLGISTGMGVSHFLEKAMGGPTAQVNEILLTGKFLSGEESYHHGLVNRLVDDVKSEAHALAEEIASQHPLSVRSIIQTNRQRQNEGLEAALLREAAAQATCYNRGDWGVGLKAARDKTDPIFESYHNK